MTSAASKTIFYNALTDQLNNDQYLNKQQADNIFRLFNECALFRWKDANNDCEDRANAICMLLDEWNIPNYKGWVFSGYFLKKEMGSLINSWNYHVAALLPVLEYKEIKYYIIDPATCGSLISIADWAENITDIPNSYYFIRNSSYYIFSGKIKKDNWYKRNKRNRRWTIQGLSGINGVSSIGKAKLSFLKGHVKNVEQRFNILKSVKPDFD